MSSTATLSESFRYPFQRLCAKISVGAPGQEFIFIPKGHAVLLMPVPEKEELAGLARGSRKTGYRDRKDRF